MGGPGADLFVYQHNRRAQLTAILHNGTVYDQMTYDAAGWPTGGTLANGVETTIEYTARRERKRVTAMLGDQMLTDFIWSHDANGNVVEETQGHVGATRTMQYMLNTDWALGEAWANGITDESAFTYDAGGNRLTKLRNGASATYSYDADNRLFGETRQVPAGTQTIQQTGTVAVDSTKAGRDPAVIANNDTDDNPDAAHAWMAKETPQEHWAAIEFDVPKPVDTISLWIPTAGQPTLPPQANPNARPPGAPSAGLTSFRLEIKKNGQWGPPAGAVVTGATANGDGFYSTTAHEITAAFPQQTVEAVRAFMNAGGGSEAHPNRFMVNELQASVTASVFDTKQIDYAFDGNGNMVGRSVSGAGGIESEEVFGYRYDDRLESYLGPAGFFTYLHTPGGQRINKTNVTAGTEQWFKYDGPDVISDNTRTSGTSEFNLEATYVQLLSIDSKQVRLGADGSQRYYLGAGSIARIVDGAGSVLETLVNTMFGEDIVGPTLGDRHGFQRRERNAEVAILGGTPMYDYRQRIGNPENGQFIQLDPLNPEGDHYVLANNNPLRFTDPRGLQGTDIVGQEVRRQIARNPSINVPTWVRVPFELELQLKEGMAGTLVSLGHVAVMSRPEVHRAVLTAKTAEIQPRTVGEHFDVLVLASLESGPLMVPLKIPEEYGRRVDAGARLGDPAWAAHTGAYIEMVVPAGDELFIAFSGRDRYARTYNAWERGGKFGEASAQWAGTTLLVYEGGNVIRPGTFTGGGQALWGGPVSLSPADELAVAESLSIKGFRGSRGANPYHALDRAIERGVSPKAILETVRNPSVVVEQGGGRTLYLTKDAAVVLDSTGQAVTIWGAAQHTPATLDLLCAAGAIE